MWNSIRYGLAIFFIRKEITLLLVMALAVPVMLIYRGVNRSQQFKAEAHQQQAIKLMQEGPQPNLVVLNLDVETDIAKTWTQEYLSNPNFPVLVTYRQKVNGSSTPDVFDIVDFRPRALSTIPIPNLFIKTQGVDALGMYYAFQGPDALSQANQFLERYCLFSKIEPPQDAFNSDLESGEVSTPWSTQLTAIRGNKMGARMWWGNQYYLNTCTVLHSQSSRTPQYIFLDNSSWNYCEPFIDQSIQLRKVN